MRYGSLADARSPRDASHALASREHRAARALQLLDYAFFVLYVLLSFEIVLELLGAHPGAAFHRFTEWATRPFFAPFERLLYEPAAGPHRLVFSYLMGLVAYAIAHMALAGLVRVWANPRRRL